MVKAAWDKITSSDYGMIVDTNTGDRWNFYGRNRV